MALLHFSYILFYIFLAIIPISNGDNYAKYTACSIPYSCGNIQNVGYPFWGENRPKFCGKPEFKLDCLDVRNNPVMYVFGHRYVGLSVNSINTSSHTIVFSLDELFRRCYYLNASKIPYLSDLVPVESMYENISIFYGCNSSVSSFRPKSFRCYNYYNGLGVNNGTAFAFDNQDDIRRINDLGLCKNNISFLVDKRGLNELRSDKYNLSLLRALTKWPIEAKYLVNFSACSECEKSGGRCGSSEDLPLGPFVCYCRDGIRSLACPSGKKKLILIFVLGIAGGILILVAIIGAFSYSKKLKSRSRSVSLDINAIELRKENMYFGVPLFSYSELVEATGNFDQSNVLGDGGFGIVYHGKLKDGREVAVKRLYEKNLKRVKQFMNEVELLTHLRHQNLVSLYGCTSHQCKELLLVYEFIKNGTVADHLYGEKSKLRSLPWPIRLKIAIETASALSYLHASDIIHRDVKTSNILLDSNFGVKVVDFGLSRLFPTDVTHVSTAPQGTPGYLDPEYFQCYQLTDKSDVYSFGVVLIELISSLPAVDLDRSKQEINLSHYAINKINKSKFDELVDPQLGFRSDPNVRKMIILVAELAYQCLQHDKEFRPSMDEVLEGLNSIEGAKNVELGKEKMAKEDKEVVKFHCSDPSPSLVNDDNVGLLRNNKLSSSSPNSVMDKWVSRSTTPYTSK